MVQGVRVAPPDSQESLLRHLHPAAYVRAGETMSQSKGKTVRRKVVRGRVIAWVAVQEMPTVDSKWTSQPSEVYRYRKDAEKRSKREWGFVSVACIIIPSTARRGGRAR